MEVEDPNIVMRAFGRDPYFLLTSYLEWGRKPI